MFDFILHYAILNFEVSIKSPSKFLFFVVSNPQKTPRKLTSFWPSGGRQKIRCFGKKSIEKAANFPPFPFIENWRSCPGQGPLVLKLYMRRTVGGESVRKACLIGILLGWYMASGTRSELSSRHLLNNCCRL